MAPITLIECDLTLHRASGGVLQAGAPLWIGGSVERATLSQRTTRTEWQGLGDSAVAWRDQGLVHELALEDVWWVPDYEVADYVPALNQELGLVLSWTDRSTRQTLVRIYTGVRANDASAAAESAGGWRRNLSFTANSMTQVVASAGSLLLPDGRFDASAGSWRGVDYRTGAQNATWNAAGWTEFAFAATAGGQCQIRHDVAGDTTGHFTMTDGESYWLRFRGKGSVSGLTLQPSVSLLAAPYTTLWNGPSVPMATAWQRYGFRFDAPVGLTASTALFLFTVGNGQTGTWAMDDIELRRT